MIKSKLELAGNHVFVTSSWSEFKTLLDGTSASLSYVYSDHLGFYNIATEPFIGFTYVYALDQSNAPADKTDFDNNYKNIPYRKQNSNATTQSVFVAGAATLPVSVSNFPSIQQVTGTVTTNIVFPATQSVFLASGSLGFGSGAPLWITGSVTSAGGSGGGTVTQGPGGVSPWLITGSVFQINQPTTQSVKIDQSVSLPVSISNFPTVQTVTGTVATTVTFPVTQSVFIGGYSTSPQPVSVSNTPTVNQGTSPWNVDGSVSITGNVNTISAEKETFSVLSLNTQIGNGKSMLSILNGAGSTKVVKIHKIKIINSQTSAVTGIIADFRINRITGHSVGTLLTPQTFDTADIIDVNVTTRTGATLVGTGADLIRYLWSSDEWGVGTLDKEGHDHGIQATIPVYESQPGIKPITIRVGEGIAIRQIVNSTAGTFDIEVIFSEE